MICAHTWRTCALGVEVSEDPNLSEHPRSPSEGLVRWVEFYVFTSVCYYRPPVGLSSREGWVYEVLLELDVFMIVRVTTKSDL